MTVKVNSKYTYSSEINEVREWRMYSKPLNDKVAARSRWYKGQSDCSGKPIKRKRVSVPNYGVNHG